MARYVLLALAMAAAAVAVPTAAQLDLTKFANKTVMVIAPHPDDLESGAAGTLSMLIALGARVVSLIITDGSKGCAAGSHGATPCDNITPPEISAMRAKEVSAAAQLLGIARVVMLSGYSDGFLYNAPPVQVRQELTLHIRTERPEVVMSFLPYPDLSVPPDATWGDLGFHTDHMDTGRHVLEVVRGVVGSRFTFEGSGEPFLVPSLLFWSWGTGVGSSWPATHYVELTPTALEAKLAAWACHKSQYKSEDALRARWKRVVSQTAARVGLPHGTSVEAFVSFGLPAYVD
jgi:LmbE family N-acetylglucosaminyl deacetylase